MDLFNEQSVNAHPVIYFTLIVLFFIFASIIEGVI